MMKKLLYSAHFKATLLCLFITLFFAGCEQEEFNLQTSTDVDVQPLAMQTSSSGFIGRIAISADGNDHDRDDIGATPMGLAIIAHFGLQKKLVHYDYNSHIWGNKSSSQKNDMTESTLGAASRFNYDKSVFISAIDQKDKAEKSIADAINSSSSSNPLYLLVAGPMAVACEGIRRSNPDKRKYVTVISHSTWNNDHQHNGACTADGIQQTGVKFVKIKDQNAGLNGSWSEWSWLQNHSNANLKWVYSRMKKAIWDWADVSDAGMMWYLLKNDENITPSKLKSFFANSAPAPDPGEDDDSDSGSDGKNCQASGSTLAQAINNFENACGIDYDKDKGHDCDPDGKGGWICSSNDMDDSGDSSGGGDSPDNGDGGEPSGGGSGSGGNCQASGSTLTQAINNFENACGIDYDKDKGHDCDPDGKGGWICASNEIGESDGSSGGSETPSSSTPTGDSNNCQASGSTLDQAINNFENACGIDYDKDKGHDCDPDGKGGWICSSNEL